MNIRVGFLLLIFILSFSFNLGYAESKFTQTNNIAVPSFSSGEPYREVREKLIKDGWRPVILADADVCIDDDVRCANRPEMEACSGSGLAPCKFLWSKDGYRLTVFTLGMDATDDGDAAFDEFEIVELSDS